MPDTWLKIFLHFLCCGCALNATHAILLLQTYQTSRLLAQLTSNIINSSHTQCSPIVSQKILLLYQHHIISSVTVSILIVQRHLLHTNLFYSIYYNSRGRFPNSIVSASFPTPSCSSYKKLPCTLHLADIYYYLLWIPFYVS